MYLAMPADHTCSMSRKAGEKMNGFGSREIVFMMSLVLSKDSTISAVLERLARNMSDRLICIPNRRRV